MKAAEALGYDRKTVAGWHKYYAKEDRENGVYTIGSDKAPSRDILKNKIRTESFVSIGKEYGVDGNTIKEWCVKYGLPHHKRQIKLINDKEWALI